MTRRVRMAKPFNPFRPPSSPGIRRADRISWYLLPFHPESYGPAVANILLLDDAGGGARPMDLFPRACASETARAILLKADAHTLFPGAGDPESALSGLLLYFSCLSEAHDLLHRVSSPDGPYWHAIMHRMEGDAGNAGYWFRHVGQHPVYPALHHEAARLGYAPNHETGRSGYAPRREWDPFAFIRFCESSAPATSGSKDEFLAKSVQLAEWQLLFDYCAAPVQAIQSASRVAAR